VNILHEDCDPTLAEDPKLPYTAYLVEYLQDGITKFDITVASKQVDIFDHYWDHYRSDFKNMTQSEGKVNPKMWGNSAPKPKSKK